MALTDIEKKEEIPQEDTEEIKESIVEEEKEIKEEMLEWQPRTELGRKVKAGEITDLKKILQEGIKIKEPEIIDFLLPDLEVELINIGQAKGKFGGGKRIIFKQTQKKTAEGNIPKFTTMVVVGNKNGFVGVGIGKAKETLPARQKALRQAKLNIIYVPRACGSWECTCNEKHSIPFQVKGKCSSAEIILKPAPKGAGLVVEKECAKILKLAGIKDVYSKTRGQTRTKINLVKACIEALKQLSKIKR